jgi:SulP family sulfate permease
VVEARAPLVGEDMPDALAPRPATGGAGDGADPEVVVYRISGVVFFGAAASIGSVLDRISAAHRALVVDVSAVPFLDSTGAHVLEGLSRKASRGGVRMFVAGASPELRRVLLTHGVRPPVVTYVGDLAEALEAYRAARRDAG